MDTEIINEIGFSNAEKKVYLALLELGSSTAAPILKKTSLQNSVFYRTIHRLIEKGFVSFIKKGKIKHYKAADPKILLTYLKEKENRLKNIIPELKEKQKLASDKEETEMYSGFKGVKTMLYSLIEDAKKGEKYYFFNTGIDIYPELQKRLFLQYDQLRKEKGLKVFGILNIKSKKYMKKGRHPTIRYVNFPIPPTISIFGDKIAMMSWGNLEKPKGILITSKEIADQYKQFFNEMWKTAKL